MIYLVEGKPSKIFVSGNFSSVFTSGKAPAQYLTHGVKLADGYTGTEPNLARPISTGRISVDTTTTSASGISLTYDGGAFPTKNTFILYVYLHDVAWAKDQVVSVHGNGSITTSPARAGSSVNSVTITPLTKPVISSMTNSLDNDGSNKEIQFILSKPIPTTPGTTLSLIYSKAGVFSAVDVPRPQTNSQGDITGWNLTVLPNSAFGGDLVVTCNLKTTEAVKYLSTTGFVTEQIDWGSQQFTLTIKKDVTPPTILQFTYAAGPGMSTPNGAVLSQKGLTRVYGPVSGSTMVVLSKGNLDVSCLVPTIDSASVSFSLLHYYTNSILATSTSILTQIEGPNTRFIWRMSLGGYSLLFPDSYPLFKFKVDVRDSVGNVTSLVGTDLFVDANLYNQDNLGKASSYVDYCMANTQGYYSDPTGQTLPAGPAHMTQLLNNTFYTYTTWAHAFVVEEFPTIRKAYDGPLAASLINRAEMYIDGVLWDTSTTLVGVEGTSEIPAGAPTVSRRAFKFKTIVPLQNWTETKPYNSTVSGYSHTATFKFYAEDGDSTEITIPFVNRVP
jgi:hypothetical protein